MFLIHMRRDLEPKGTEGTVLLMQLEVAALATQKKLLALAAADGSHINALSWVKPKTPLTSAF